MTNPCLDMNGAGRLGEVMTCSNSAGDPRPANASDPSPINLTFTAMSYNVVTSLVLHSRLWLTHIYLHRISTLILVGLGPTPGGGQLHPTYTYTLCVHITSLVHVVYSERRAHLLHCYTHNSGYADCSPHNAGHSKCRTLCRNTHCIFTNDMTSCRFGPTNRT